MNPKMGPDAHDAQLPTNGLYSPRRSVVPLGSSFADDATVIAGSPEPPSGLMQWPPQSLNRAKSKARVRADKPIENSLLIVRQRAALLEAKQFAHNLEVLINKLNGPGIRETSTAFEEEFLRIEITALPGHYQKQWFTTALEKRNIPLNRYVNIMAMDSTRVKLIDVDPGESDYINASYIEGVPTEISYIAAQSPLPSTFGHFWQMVWEQGVSVIVMLTKLVEYGKTKGEQYWPDTGSILYGSSYLVVFESERQKGSALVVRQFYLWKALPGQERDVEMAKTLGRLITHIQYTKWPDHGIPKTCKNILELLAMVDELIIPDDYALASADEEAEPYPVLVHCSAGIGRTGTYISVDVALRRFYALHNKTALEAEQLKKLGIEPMTVHGLATLVRRLKQQRFGMVQTWQQYRFAYIAFLYGIRLLLAKEQREIELLEHSQRRQEAKRKKMSHFGMHSEDDGSGDDMPASPGTSKLEEMRGKFETMAVKSS
eukprot:CAMPEP_0184693164 /NCGR_PEP_ID=MMETSP0313-20130426/1442_1 /TAXON_ID=2792 /ORGANISM="Porphyridium aerugineum, Strain SAG 1380-2" /LENGTH=487 /DNA_ID=CAMNT_0027151155 /DNA_START=547 /DNA_END=2010 /DNA_ORIENTATION=+